MTALFEDAINQLKRLSVDYPPGNRVIEPHALGYTKDGNLVCRAYQVSGASASGEHANWKLFRMDRMGAAAVGGGDFSGPRDGYKRGDRAMQGGIIAEL